MAGGHTFGEARGADDPDKYVGPAPEGASLENQGLGWINPKNEGHGVDTITSGIEGAWSQTPIQWDNNYFDVLSLRIDVNKKPCWRAPMDTN